MGRMDKWAQEDRKQENQGSGKPDSLSKPKTGELKMGRREGRQNQEMVDRSLVWRQGIIAPGKINVTCCRRVEQHEGDIGMVVETRYCRNKASLDTVALPDTLV